MENKRFEHIITRYLKGKATPEEEAELLQAIHASKEWAFKSTEEEIQGIADLVNSFRNSHYTSLGIICKTESQAKELVQKLQIYANDISLLSNQSSAYVKGIIITSAHMAKGLEFDEVIIPQTDDKNYHSNIDKSMLYVAVTRAMHKLTLTYSTTLPSCQFL